MFVTIEARQENAIKFCKQCLGVEAVPRESSPGDLLFTPCNTVFRPDSLNHMVFAARMYMRVIGGAFSMVFSPDTVILSARAPNGEAAEEITAGDDIDICDSLMRLCLALDEKLSAKAH